jgi:hypothetical protein
MSLTSGLLLDPSCPIEWAHPLNRGLVSDWTIGPNSGWRGGATLRDLTRGGRKSNDAPLTNGPAWGAGAVAPFGSLKFDGVDDYTAATLPTAIAGPFAVALWIKAAASQSFKNPFGSSSSLCWYTQTSGASGLDLALYTNPPDGSFSSITVTGVMDSTWHRVAAVFTGASWRGYRDGRLIASASPAGTVVGYNGTVPFATFETGRGAGGNYCSCALSGVGLWAGAGLFRSAPDTFAAVDYAESRRGNPERFRWLRPWSFGVPATGGGGVTGDSSATLAGATGSAAGTLALAAAGAGTLAGASGSATATLALAGASSATLAGATGSAAGAVALSAAASATLAGATGSAAAALLVTANAAGTLAGATGSATGGTGGIVADSAATLAGATGSATARLAIAASASATLAGASGSATGGNPNSVGAAVTATPGLRPRVTATAGLRARVTATPGLRP